MQTCLNSLKRINKILQEPDDEDIENGKDAKILNGDIEFKNVYMSYTENEEVLKDISFVIKKGSKTAIAGKTGAGKTTLTKLIMRLYDIKSGKILIDGCDISKVSIKSLRSNISYISQTPYIFEETLRNNITLGNDNIKDKEILAIIKELDLNNLFSRFKHGLDEKIKESELSMRRTATNIFY
ncbi:MAG: ATP-binding cassette domain-containing protein, partial [Clostridia bacterium]|nr:ATP-binding cassette domain-containing protein [Clostridia bacterium]